MKSLPFPFNSLSKGNKVTTMATNHIVFFLKKKNASAKKKKMKACHLGRRRRTVFQCHRERPSTLYLSGFARPALSISDLHTESRAAILMAELK